MNNTISSRTKTIYFKRINFDKTPVYNLTNILGDIYKKCGVTNYNGISRLDLDDGRSIYLYAIQHFNISDVPSNHYYVYALDISCIDTNGEVRYGDLSRKVRQRVRTPEEIGGGKNKDTVGPLGNTRVLVDPRRHIIELCRGMNQLNQKDTLHFLGHLFNYDYKHMSFSTILNRNAYKRVENMSYIEKFEYKVATPSTKSQFFSTTGKTESDILRFKHIFGTQSFNMIQTVKTSDPDKIHKIISFIKDLTLGRNKPNTKKAKIIGKDKRGKIHKINFLRNELKYIGSLKYKNRINYHNYFQLLIKAYFKKYEYLDSTFPNESEMEANDKYAV